MLKNPQKTGNFRGIRDNLLKMVDRCKSISEINYLRRDKNAAKVLLTKLAKNRPEIAKECEEHIKWIDTVYTQALNEKAKELRGYTIEESGIDIVNEASIKYTDYNLSVNGKKNIFPFSYY